MSDPLASLPAFRELAAERLRAFPHTTIPDAPGMRRAGVVVCVLEHEGVPSVVVILRANRGRNAGQWGLPGGRVDEGETPEEAALRELYEETGLIGPPSDDSASGSSAAFAPQSAEVLGRLDDFPAASGFAITPIVVAVTEPGPLRLSPDEVHSVHHATLRTLAADDTPRWVPQLDGGSMLQMRLGPDWLVHAPTGAILWQFREVVLLGRQARVADFLQPGWTRT